MECAMFVGQVLYLQKWPGVLEEILIQSYVELNGLKGFFQVTLTLWLQGVVGIQTVTIPSDP